MKKPYTLLTLLSVAVLFSGCDLVEGVFKGGLIIGLIIAAIIIGLIAWLFIKAFEKRPAR